MKRCNILICDFTKTNINIISTFRNISSRILDIYAFKNLITKVKKKHKQ